ncbi:TPA: hypothetical protein ACN99F_002740 [Vibrio metschnikovii]|uniref:hypothetical protein n=1 Tax=unclassified Vibrio TaxID=2614977 RepID=UPI00148302D7|nr:MULTISPECIES: hypothetical protein [unclassified Vibrio]NNN45526.1 hypothetical protein [Vibrio sp. 1-1(7)]NNN73190.1 hypothetical protein [Vibrio sp. 12-2(3-a)]
MTFKQKTLAVVITATLIGCNAEDNKELPISNDNVYPPIATEVVAPALYVGETVKGTYKFVDPNATPRAEEGSAYSWRNAADETEIVATQVLPVYAYLEGLNLKFCVTPKAQGDINTVGTENCSLPKTVNGPLGEKPVATNVAITPASTPTVGDTLTGSYDYTGETEGTSAFAWKTSTDTVGTEQTITLGNTLEGKQVQFCVTPKTDSTPAVAGDEVCSALTDAITAKAGSAPVASNITFSADAFVGVELTADYAFTDADGDLEGSSTYSWKSGVNEVSTTKTYTPVEGDKGTALEFCVTPVAKTGTPTSGTEVCATTTPVAVVSEAKPTASNVIAEVEAPATDTEVGATLRGNYDYAQADGSLEGASTAVWKVDNIAGEVCTDARTCDYTITQADLGKALDFCVTPQTALNTAGDEVCLTSKVTPKGIKIEGKLEYDQELIATVYGYAADATLGEWKVDTSNKNGPAGDLAPTVQKTSNTYKIGARNGLLTDYAWFAAPEVLEARDFIGKTVEYCVDVNGTEKCVNAANSASVTGGLYYDATDASKRGIEPIREIVNGALIYHRPLTVAETQLKDKVGFGANLLTAAAPQPFNGIEWAMYNHNQVNVYEACTNLYADNTWALPIGNTGGYYDGNHYPANNAPDPSGDSSMSDLNANQITSNEEDDRFISPVFGWPTGAKTPVDIKTHYMSASMRTTADKWNGTYWSLRMYASVNSSSANLTPDTNMFVSCVTAPVIP